MGYQERLIWGQFLPTAVLYGYYFVELARSRHGGPVPSLVGIVTVLALMQIVFFIFVAALSRKEPRDERVRLMEYKAYKVAYLSALFVAVVWLSMALQGSATLTAGRLSETVLLAGLVGIELLRSGTLLLLHRAGAAA